MSRPREDDAGLVLVNVLVMLTLAASVVFLMLSVQQTAVEGVRLRSAASQAERLAEAGEASVVVALRRDMGAAPEVDHLFEPWAGVVQEEVRLEGAGRFSVRIEDLQGRYDLNRLGGGGLAEGPVFGRLLAALSLPPEIGERIGAQIRAGGPLQRVDEILAGGVSETALEALRPHVTVLDAPEPVNLNAVGPLLLGALLRDPVAAQRMVGIRTRTGMLRPADLQGAGLLQPIGTGFTSQNWESTVSAEVDGVTRTLRSRLLRRAVDDAPAVFVVDREWVALRAGQAAPGVAEIQRLLTP